MTEHDHIQDALFAPEADLPDDGLAPGQELTPEQEKEIDDLIDQGVYNPQTARAVVLGLFFQDR